MCGIAGSFGRPLAAAPGAEDELLRVLAHRGPDGFGRFDDDSVSLMHWRLAVIDLTLAGSQPMTSRDERYVIAYNGEVYGFDALRAEVEEEWRKRAAGVSVPRWRGRSDTEVVLEAYGLWGAAALRRLNGMFALAIYDRERRRLVLARDRAGIKPLYVWSGDGFVLFASEAKLFSLVAGFRPGIDARGLSAFFTYGHCHGEHHVLAGVRQMDPGEVLTLDRGDAGGVLRSERGRLAPRPAWMPMERPDGDVAAKVRRALQASVERQLVADVPVGVLLSGGVDSSILTALAARTLGPRRTMAFTLGYPGMGADYDEIAYARRVATHLGVEHHVHEASQDDLVADIERLVWHYDEPFADAAALNVFLLSRLIRSHVTVALAGEGSDELFGGYRRYHHERALRALGPAGRLACAVVRATQLERVGFLPRRARILARTMARPSAAARYSAFLESEIAVGEVLRPEWHVPIGVHPDIVEGYPDELGAGPVGLLCAVDQRFWLPSTYLEKSDKGGMAHALEVRVPFLDNEVVELANTLSDRQRIRGLQRKWILRRAFGDLLPSEVFTRFKRGFGVPVARWLREGLTDYYADRVLSPDARVRRFLHVPVVERSFREHVRGVADYSGLLWKCLVLEVWLRHHERGFRSVAAEPPAPAYSARHAS